MLKILISTIQHAAYQIKVSLNLSWLILIDEQKYILRILYL